MFSIKKKKLIYILLLIDSSFWKIGFGFCLMHDYYGLLSLDPLGTLNSSEAWDFRIQPDFYSKQFCVSQAKKKKVWVVMKFMYSESKFGGVKKNGLRHSNV